MRSAIFLPVMFLLSTITAQAEVIQIGAYSGKVGYYVQIGTDFRLKQEAVIMNNEAYQKILKLDFIKLGQLKTCDVEGTQQSIGYTIFKVKSCK
jgi:hypothetical protein